MKKLLLTVVLGLFAITGFSRAKYDVHAGLSMANITNSEASMKAGFSVGLGMIALLTIYGHSRLV